MKASSITRPLLLSMFILSLILLPVMSAATDVGGIIYTDTTWSLAGSPYNIISELQTADGVTLTIEPGVVVNGNGNQLELRGNLNAIGAETSKISINNIFLIEQSKTVIVTIQFAVINAGSYYFRQDNSRFILRDSKIQNVSTITMFPSDNLDDSFVERNVFVNCGPIRVENSAPNYVHIRNNVFYQQTGPLQVDGNPGELSHAVIEYNSFISTDRIALLAWPNAQITAINNY